MSTNVSKSLQPLAKVVPALANPVSSREAFCQWIDENSVPVTVTMCRVNCKKKARCAANPPSNQESAVSSSARQLNGLNGEATNSDDVKGRRVVEVDVVSRRRRRRRRQNNPQSGGFVIKTKDSMRSITGNNVNSRKQKQPYKTMRSVDPLHPAVEQYAQVLAQPNNRAALPIGIPHAPTSDSQKTMGFIDFNVNIPSGAGTGFGFVSFNPSPFNDQVQVSYSSGAYAGSTIPAQNAAATGQSTSAVSNLPYATAAGGGALAARIVAAGLSCRSIAPALYESGVAYALQQPQHQTVGNLGSTNLTAYKTCVTLPICRDGEYHVSYHPITDVESTYTPTVPWPINNSAASAIAGILFVNGTSTALTMQCRYTVWVEYVGSTCDAAASRNQLPPPGSLDAVVAAKAKSDHLHAAHPHISGETKAAFTKTMTQLLAHGTHKLKGSLGPLIQSTLGGVVPPDAMVTVQDLISFA